MYLLLVDTKPMSKTVINTFPRNINNPKNYKNNLPLFGKRKTLIKAFYNSSLSTPPTNVYKWYMVAKSQTHITNLSKLKAKYIINILNI